MRCTGYEMARYKGTQASHREIDESLSKHCTHTYSDNGVYVACILSNSVSIILLWGYITLHIIVFESQVFIFAQLTRLEMIYLCG